MQAKFFVPSTTLWAFLCPWYLLLKIKLGLFPLLLLTELELPAPLAWTHQLCLHKVQDQTSLEKKAVKFNLEKEDFYLVWCLQMQALGRQGQCHLPHYCYAVFRVITLTVILTQAGICFVSALVIENYPKPSCFWDWDNVGVRVSQEPHSTRGSYPC